MITTPRSVKPGITWTTWLAAAVLVSAVFVAFMLPHYYGGCRPGWHRWDYGSDLSYCAPPPPEDEMGYSPHNLLPLKIAVGVGGALLARAVVMAGRRRRGVAAVEAAVALILIGMTAFVFLYPSKAEQTGNWRRRFDASIPAARG